MNRAGRWPGRVCAAAVPGRHHFTLDAVPGGTRLLHGEDLAGLVPLTFTKVQIARDFVPAYEAVNVALAARVAALG
uniref:Uncharacterized protein n=1 Tax=Phenylobacterium glaciei TaxID=2803784 RepID=A0A974P1M2_9CAUL|nr:hypothetical protein JKL49_17650 [Phenylobacterium glaciei]